jgi:hypothetical protein
MSPICRSLCERSLFRFAVWVPALTDPTIGTPHSKSFFGRLMRPVPIERSQRISPYGLLGLSILYASAYFLPVTASGAYFLPSGGICRLILLPTLVAVVTVGATLLILSVAAQRWFTSRWQMLGTILALSLLSLIALKGLLGAAGYDWEDRLPRGSDLLTAQRHFKVMAFIIVFAAVCLMRGALQQLTRLLGGLGFAFAALAAARLFAFEWHQDPETPVSRTLDPVQAETSAPESTKTRNRSKRVVWVLFDETDFGRLYDSRGVDGFELENFNRLARMSVFASNANSPASATLFSIPALLTGVPISGDGIRIDKAGLLSLQSSSGGVIPFENAQSIFGAIAAGGKTSSILGFLHPYCRLFSAQKCDSFHWPEMGRLDSALLANIPSTVSSKFGHADAWDTITQESLRLLPDYLARDDALTFVHLNVPHPPAAYGDKALHLPPSSDPLVEYRHNLLFADGILGDIILQVQRQSETHEVLLVVSTDHWLRNMWYQARVPDAT